ncbi:MAG TPA: glyoxalase [Actinobacteria bacterium]|nr:glyoxalase [Actinomycetota bacterium]
MGKAELGPGRARWTHLALRVDDVDRSIAWYERYTHLRVLQRSSDEFGRGTWLADPLDAAVPFVLVLSEFHRGVDPFGGAPDAILGPFAHIGIELPTREAVDEVAAMAERDGVLALRPTQMPPPIGYICFVEDPDGNTVEFSFDQGTYATVRREWGGG